MSNYIEREDALIVAEIGGSKETIKTNLKSLSSADVVEVVRCKDCDFWNKDEDVLGGRCDEWSDFENGTSRYTGRDDFCSYGERKDE